MNDESDDQLQTHLIFIDAEAFVRERFDWQSKSLSRLKELVKSGELKILTTRITKSEVRGKIQEALNHANVAVKKHDVILRQLGGAEGLRAANSPEATTKLLELFEAYMREVRAVEIPISRDVDRIFDNYFEQRPPFSAKKKSEFPDAFVVSSLHENARASGSKIYVVSGDPDMKACCEHAEELIVADSIADVISKATVTKTIHDKLLTFLQEEAHLRGSLENSLHSAEVKFEGRHRFDRHIDVDSTINDVQDIQILGLNVLSREGNKFTCEIEFDAWVTMNLVIDVEGRIGFHEEEYEGPEEIYTTYSHSGSFYAEVVMRYDPLSPDLSEIDLVGCSPTIEIDLRDIVQLERFK